MGLFYHCRLYDLHTGNNLLLDGCSAQVSITDVHAAVTISQKFTCSSNHGNSAHQVSGVYMFSLMRDAAVCKFEMVRGDGTKVEGVVKEKEEAKREYDEALRQGYTASLGQQETGDVFSISVGSIAAEETVTINLKYVQSLIDDEKKNQVKFIFPRTYAQRYGSAPTVNSAFGRTVQQPFTMNATVQQAGSINAISCPSGHPISLEFNHQNSRNNSIANVLLQDRSGFLSNDVVLVITATGLDAPRCFIEQHSSPNHETTALALTFVPRFNVPDVQGGVEYIFLVDRSGSMHGQNIQLVREALVVLLRGLPTNGTTFNIFSFGSEATKLWDQSRAYDQSSLEEATLHVDSMQADYGGTEIASALRLVYDSLPKSLIRPVAVFLLTDGGAWDVSTCIKYTQSARTTLPGPKTFIRVFSVGIGDGASSDTCESISRAGGGMTVYVKQGEPLTGKCSRLVRAARTPEVRVNVDWGLGEKEEQIDEPDDFEFVDKPTPESASPVNPPSATISLFDPDSDDMDVDPSINPILHPTGPPPKPNPTLPPPPRIQQSPLASQIPSIFPGSRTQIYAIVRTPKNNTVNSMTTEIKVRGVVTTTGDLVELVVPVSKVLSSPTVDALGFPFLHTLAAKALIKDREEGKHAFPPSASALFDSPNLNTELKETYLEKEIIRLGTEYHLASRYTSFLAVDRRSSGGQKLLNIVPTMLFGSASSSTTTGKTLFTGGGFGGFGSTGGPRKFGSANTRSRGYGSAAVAMPMTSNTVHSNVSFGMGLMGSSQGPIPYSITTGGGALFGSSSPPVFGGSTGPPPPTIATVPFGALPPPPPGRPPQSIFGHMARFGNVSSSTPLAPPAPAPASPNFSPSSPMANSSFFGSTADDSEGEDADGSVPNNISPKSSVNPFSSTISSSSDSYHILGTTAQQHQRTPGSLLAAVARLQQWHGGFKLTSTLLQLLGEALNVNILLLLGSDPNDNNILVKDFAKKLESQVGIEDPDVGATLFALVWMEKYNKASGSRVVDDSQDDNDETRDMREKAQEWVNSQLRLGADSGDEQTRRRLGELKGGVERMLGLE
ncbi:MAG: von Willebrand factor type A domain-containing protein [Lentinula lateritia]|uniref:von Willebrand factor type A domain-containing protein n=1 Tax=Lentinula lateritia TaxID=40482 RepID=A0ABQ8VJJ4_9AGAR|nr:MAG: von Willebrand factor type A domain-containing protein [Lentinula lateritia]KAJ4496566.1 von Willebrand factor type A domain-containing protein [Lentinula lateritia]